MCEYAVQVRFRRSYFDWDKIARFLSAVHWIVTRHTNLMFTERKDLQELDGIVRDATKKPSSQLNITLCSLRWRA